MRIRLVCLLMLFTAIGFTGFAAPYKNAAYQRYIEKYAALAVQHQKQHGIPASITLAQGIMESGAGLSELARESNNHFGIKCHNDWRGARVYHDDDAKGECFRKYKRVEDSYEDHSHFLADHPRYARLFKLHVTDYKNWARGLQQYGYATDRAYANKLIKIIEDYNLYNFDTKQKATKAARTTATSALTPHKRNLYKSPAGLLYVHAVAGDVFEQIAADVSLVDVVISAKTLHKYNEMPEDYSLQKGDIVYLEKKKRKAAKQHKLHTVRVGESMHSISQQYGVRMESLYRMNDKPLDYVPEKGDVLKLR